MEMDFNTSEVCTAKWDREAEMAEIHFWSQHTSEAAVKNFWGKALNYEACSESSKTKKVLQSVGKHKFPGCWLEVSFHPPGPVIAQQN
jgi:hypothetical protein